jgi:hypothetical protein
MKRRICVLMPPGDLYSAVGRMIGGTLVEQGWEVSVPQQADPEALDHEVLLVGGASQQIDGLPGVLRRRRNRKPVTLLWQLEPLPPPGLSPAGEWLGLRAAAWEWERLPVKVRLPLDRVLPFASLLSRHIRRALVLPYSMRRAGSPHADGWGEYYASHFVAAATEWRWLRIARNQGWIDHWFASNLPRVQFLRNRGIDAEMIPMGYHPGWGRDLGLPRDIEVLCLAHLDRRPRGRKLRWLREALANWGCTLTLLTGVHGATREQTLNRARIVLSLMRRPHDFPGMRVLMGLACGALVVSEAGLDTGAYVPDRHLVVAPLEQLPERIHHYLEHETERARIAAEGHRFVTEELTLKNQLTRMLAGLPTHATS